MVWHAESSYTDVYGQTHWDDTLQQYTFKLVLPGPEQTVLTEEDMPYLAGSWAPGDTMGTAAYYERVKRAGVRAYLDQAAGIGGENSFVKQISLVYPGRARFGRTEMDDREAVLRQSLWRWKSAASASGSGSAKP